MSQDYIYADRIAYKGAITAHSSQLTVRLTHGSFRLGRHVLHGGVLSWPSIHVIVLLCR